MSAFPSNDVLVARGKYSTLAAEKRAYLKEMRNSLESASTCAGRVLRAPDDGAFMLEQAVALASHAARVMDMVAMVDGVQTQLNQLKPLAWGGKAVEHEQQ